MIPAYNYTYWVSQANKHHNGGLHSVQLGLSFFIADGGPWGEKTKKPKDSSHLKIDCNWSGQQFTTLAPDIWTWARFF